MKSGAEISFLPLHYTASTKQLLENRLLGTTWYFLNQNSRNMSVCVSAHVFDVPKLL